MAKKVPRLFGGVALVAGVALGAVFTPAAQGQSVPPHLFDYLDCPAGDRQMAIYEYPHEHDPSGASSGYASPAAARDAHTAMTDDASQPSADQQQANDSDEWEVFAHRDPAGSRDMATLTEQRSDGTWVVRAAATCPARR